VSAARIWRRQLRDPNGPYAKLALGVLMPMLFLAQLAVTMGILHLLEAQGVLTYGTDVRTSVCNLNSHSFIAHPLKQTHRHT
jgi:hypothetical protein